MLNKERQAEFERANASDVAKAALEVQHAAEQQRTAHLTGQLQEAASQAQVHSFCSDHNHTEVQ